MRVYSFILFITFLLFSTIVNSQKVDPVAFFQEDGAVSLQMWGHLKNIAQPKQQGIKRPGFASMVFPDSSEFKSQFEFASRGKFRLEMCNPPPLMLYFKNKNKGPLNELGKLKMVWACESGEYYNKLVLREYLVYKMYNLITPYSFRVRLLNVVFNDSSRNGSPIHRTGFLMEDIDDLASRLHCREFQDTVINAREANQQFYALMVMFQYMIGNTDWAIVNYQNIKLIVDNTSTIIQPIAIPYDFDNSGFVNANYALPPETMPINNVAERYNKGIALSIENIKMATEIFKKAEPEIMLLVENTKGLSPSDRRYVKNYLQGFFDEMKNFKHFSNIFLKDN